MMANQKILPSHMPMIEGQAAHLMDYGCLGRNFINPQMTYENSVA